jgi:hypothetical protein
VVELWFLPNSIKLGILLGFWNSTGCCGYMHFSEVRSTTFRFPKRTGTQSRSGTGIATSFSTISFMVPPKSSCINEDGDSISWVFWKKVLRQLQGRLRQPSVSHTVPSLAIWREDSFRNPSLWHSFAYRDELQTHIPSQGLPQSAFSAYYLMMIMMEKTTRKWGKLVLIQCLLYARHCS